MKLLLSPHNDDEALFASYTLLEHQPLVIVCFQGRRKKNYVDAETREAETAEAMQVLGCDYLQLAVPCDPPGWLEVASQLRLQEPSHVFAPLPELDGHPQHNGLGNLAVALWPGRVSFYSTYTLRGGRSVIGERVPEQAGWPELKRRALACYHSQNSKPDTAMHFRRGPAEYVIPAESQTPIIAGTRLNLGSGPNPIAGFVNLDKETGWRFEDGLGMYEDASVAAITVSHVLMYVDIDHWPFVFSEFARVLEPGGMVRITEDSTADPASSRQGLRHRAAVATTPELVLEQLEAAGLQACETGPTVSQFADRSLIQRNYGDPPDVFHVEGAKP